MIQILKITMAYESDEPEKLSLDIQREIWNYANKGLRSIFVEIEQPIFEEQLTDNGGDTLDLVRTSLDDAGLVPRQVDEAIGSMQNAGILFREHKLWDFSTEENSAPNAICNPASAETDQDPA